MHRDRIGVLVYNCTMYTVDDFEKILNKADGFHDRRAAVAWIATLDPVEVIGYPVTEFVIGASVIEEVSEAYQGQGAFHTQTRPYVDSEGYLEYYLFDHFVSQEDWFKITGISEPDRLAHILKWGQQ